MMSISSTEAMISSTKAMIFTDAERRLLLIFYSGDAEDTVGSLRSTLHQALSDIFEPADRAVAESLISKLSNMDELVGIDAILESEGLYVE